MTTADPWIYMSWEYYGTGEGCHTYLMVTLPYPRDGFTATEIATKKFLETFERVSSPADINFWTREEFLERYKLHLPQRLVDLSGMGCSLEFSSRLYYNFA